MTYYKIIKNAISSKASVKWNPAIDTPPLLCLHPLVTASLMCFIKWDFPLQNEGYLRTICTRV